MARGHACIDDIAHRCRDADEQRTDDVRRAAFTCAHDLCASDGRARVVAASYASPYAELAATEQLPIKSRLFRPFVREAISTAMDGNASMQAYLSLSVGFAARVW